MRMKNIPRSLVSDDNSVAEQIELGSGMSDRRVAHVGPLPNYDIVNDSERNWFKSQQDNDPDVRFSRSDYHDLNSMPNFMPDRREKRETREEELITGYIEDAILYPNGAHLKIISDDQVFFIFAPDTNFVAKGTKIKVIDKIITITHSYETFVGSGEFAQDETHLLTVLEILEDEEQVDEIITEE